MQSTLKAYNSLLATYPERIVEAQAKVKRCTQEYEDANNLLYPRRFDFNSQIASINARIEIAKSSHKQLLAQYEKTRTRSGFRESLRVEAGVEAKLDEVEESAKELGCQAFMINLHFQGLEEERDKLLLNSPFFHEEMKVRVLKAYVEAAKEEVELLGMRERELKRMIAELSPAEPSL